MTIPGGVWCDCWTSAIVSVYFVTFNAIYSLRLCSAFVTYGGVRSQAFRVVSPPYLNFLEYDAYCQTFSQK